MNAQIAEGHIEVIDISRGRKLLGIENKICGLIGEIGRPLLRNNRFRELKMDLVGVFARA